MIRDRDRKSEVRGRKDRDEWMGAPVDKCVAH